MAAAMMMRHGLRLTAVAATLLMLSACAYSNSPARVTAGAVGLPNSDARRAGGDSVVLNLLRDGSFESPTVPNGGFMEFGGGSKFSAWTVTGAPADVGIVSGSFAQNGFSFPAACGKQWLDLTGIGTTGAGVAQTIQTVKDSRHTLSFSVGNVYDPHGIFGTTSTVNVLVNGQQTFTATNRKGRGKTTQVWKQFTTTIVAPSAKTTIEFVNGDPAGDDSNGLDCVTLN